MEHDFSCYTIHELVLFRKVIFRKRWVGNFYGHVYDFGTISILIGQKAWTLTYNYTKKSGYPEVAPHLRSKHFRWNRKPKKPFDNISVDAKK